MDLEYHPDFSDWFAKLEAANEEIAGEIAGLMALLEAYGFELGEPEAKPIALSSMGLWELRRCPPTLVTPDADEPPVIRVLYGFVATGEGHRAVLLFGGDKTQLGDAWYPPAIAQAERRLAILKGQKRWRIVKHRAREGGKK